MKVTFFLLSLVAAGGAFGASMRYLTGIAINRWWHLPFPLSTFLINSTGSFCIGLLAGMLSSGRYFSLPIQSVIHYFIIIGLLGGYTTFSSFSYESMMLLREGQFLLAVSYIMATNCLGIISCLIGYYLFC